MQYSFSKTSRRPKNMVRFNRPAIQTAKGKCVAYTGGAVPVHKKTDKNVFLLYSHAAQAVQLLSPYRKYRQYSILIENQLQLGTEAVRNTACVHELSVS